MKFRQILIIFLLFRILDIGIIFISRYFIPYLGFFPYKEIAIQYNLPKLITSFANFDGAHYLLIAKNSYTTYQQAFFPLYPLLIRWLSPIFSNNLLLTGLIISNFSFLLGLIIFSKYLKVILGRSETTTPESLLDSGRPRSSLARMTQRSLVIWLIIFLLTFPTSFFFGAIYTEGLFFFLLVSTLYFLKKEKYLVTSIFAIMTSLTKFVGVFLIIPVIFHIIHKLKTKKGHINFFKLLITDYRLLIAFISPILGLTFYSLYLWQSIGDPFFFLNAQWAFGAHRSSNLILLPQVYYRYLNIFLTANFNFQYFISLFEFFVFNLVLIILILDLIKNLKPASPAGGLKIKNFNLIGLNLFSLVNLILPTLTGTLSSIPRYALFSLSFFLYFSQIKSILLKLTLGIIFVILHIIILSFFSQGYFIS